MSLIFFFFDLGVTNNSYFNISIAPSFLKKMAAICLQNPKQQTTLCIYIATRVSRLSPYAYCVHAEIFQGTSAHQNNNGKSNGDAYS